MVDKIFGLIKLTIFILIVGLLGYSGWQYMVMEIKNYQIKEEITRVLYGEIRNDEYIVKEKVLEKLNKKGVNLTYDDLNVVKEEYSCHIEFTYIDSITIPIIKKSFYFEKEINTTVTPQ